MKMIRSDLSNALIPEGMHNAGYEPVIFELGGIRIRATCIGGAQDLTPHDVRKIIIDGAILREDR
jgi:hypothetical protein